MLAPGEKKVNLRKLHKRKVWFKKNPHIYAMYMYLLMNKRKIRDTGSNNEPCI